MTFVDPIGDMITRIRNAQMRLLNNVKIPGSKFREKILDVLKQEGYIADYKLLSDEESSIKKEKFFLDLKNFKIEDAMYVDIIHYSPKFSSEIAILISNYIFTQFNQIIK